MILLSCLVLLSFFVMPLSSPTCCHDALYFADIMKTLKCGISHCKENDTTLDNLCVSCSPKPFPVFQDIQDITMPKVSKPYLICQSLELRNSTFQGRLTLSWSLLEPIPFSTLFIIKVRNSSAGHIGGWTFVGMTNETLAEITNFSLAFKYQFKVICITSTKSKLYHEVSDWFSFTGSKRTLSSPTSIVAAGFNFEGNNLEAVVKWNASKEEPCIYKVYWFPTVSMDYYEQKTVILPRDSLSVALPRLLFETGYTVSVSPYDPSGLHDVQSVELSFITPSCLTLTGGSFHVCAPGPPLNVSISWISNSSSAVLSWHPPLHIYPQNDITGYHISIDQVSGIFHTITKHMNSLSAGQNSTSVLIQTLKPFGYYVFEVRAISKGGMGSPARAYLNLNDVGVENRASYELPYHFIVPLFGVPLIFSIVMAFRTLYHRRCRKRLGYPSGLADVDDDIRPFLISSDKVELKEIVGQGAFGIVHRGFYARSKSKDEVAVKVYPSETFTRRQMLHEVDMLRVLGRHENIVGFIGFTLGLEKMFLLFEYCSLGNLHTHLVSLKPELMQMKSIPSSEWPSITTDKGHGIRLCSYIYQVAKGMEYISSLKVIHRDIAARNILMQDKSRVKIGDFGLSKDVYHTKHYSSQAQRRFPIKWMAPEAIEKQKFNALTDVWSFGVFMWEVFKLGKEPYPGISSGNILHYLKMGYRLEKPHCSQEWYDIMQSCWHKLPGQRPRFSELVCRIGQLIDTTCHYVVLEQ